MNFKLPSWLVLAAVIVVISGSIGLGYWWGTHGSDDRIAEIRGDVVADSVRFDSVRATLEDSLAVLADSMATLGGRVDTIVRVVRPATQRHAEQTGETLTQHLSARQDTAGLRLYALEEAADEEVVLSYEREVTGLRAQLVVMDERLRLTESIVTEQDTTLARLRRAFAEMQGEAERWQRKANPPFHVRLLKDGWKFAAGVGLGYLAGSL